MQGATSTVRTVAFFLPQYHPIPENDAWWGPGFTEWRNVASAKPRFRGHVQPRLPRELGFYDLRLPETRAAQVDLARTYGVDAFCYYHYWFNGRQVLQRPIQDLLDTGEPDFPFLLCWANENWTRAWDGGERRVLLEQHYSQEDDLAHLRALAPTLADPRYLTIDGRPVILIYRASLLGDPRRTTQIWRDEATRLGLQEPYLCRVESFPTELEDPILLGFDASVDFQPSWATLPTRRIDRVRRRLDQLGVPGVLPPYTKHPYRQVVSRSLETPLPLYRRFPCVTPGFDNTPRRSRGAVVLTGSNPREYREWFEQTLRRFSPYSREENLVFVNAWNEWAEGNVLEPDLLNGLGYLEAHRAAREATQK